MGLLEKVKNMFTEEVEDDDVKVEEIKKEVTHVSIESPAVKESIDDDLLEKELSRTEEKTSKPVFFNEDDFKDLNLTPREEKKKRVKEEKSLYSSKIDKEDEEEKKVFKPTPIISPVYGILDKNYHKEDIVSRTEVVKTNETEEPSIDSIRNKAYGTLEDELENTLFGNNSILFKKEKEKPKEESKDSEDDLLSDLTDDLTRELDELLTNKTKELNQESSDKDDLNEEDLLGFIDSTLYKKGDE